MDGGAGVPTLGALRRGVYAKRGLGWLLAEVLGGFARSVESCRSTRIEISEVPYISSCHPNLGDECQEMYTLYVAQ